MARAKKEKVSLEELLEQALVKEEEQLYQVPSNWVWTKLGNTVEVIMGQSPKGDETTDDSSYTPLIGGAADMGNIYPKAKRYTRKPTKTSKSGDVIVSIRATLGRPIFSDGEYCLGRGVASIRTVIMQNKFIRYFLINFEDYLYSIATGTTFAQVSKTDIENMPFPLPPLAEQQRIVERIESLFEKLDTAKELAQNALDSFENRKAAILHKAFTGELTAKWREENGVNLDSWEDKTFQEICNKITDGFHNSPKPVESGYPYIMAGHVKSTGIDFTNCLYVDEKNHKELFAKAYPEKGDILLVNIGAGTGTPAIVEIEYEFSFKNSAILKLKDEFLSKFVFYHLLYVKSKVMAEITRGGAQPFLSLKIIKGMSITLPTLREQKVIVDYLDTILEGEEKAQELCDVIEKIDFMKKAILARAFRGELGTNNPEEESAIELLKEVLKEKL